MTAIGATIGLILAIVLILRKMQPAYALMLGAVVGGICAGWSLTETVGYIMTGVNEVMPAVMRILAAGVLTGVLIVTGGAESLSTAIIRAMGSKNTYIGVALATMLLTATGVFIDVAVITVAPIAISVAARTGASRAMMLLMMIGGGKCGNVISPNPNTIICAENFHADLYSVMYANLIPAVIGFFFVVFVVSKITGKMKFYQAGAAGGTVPAAEAALADKINEKKDKDLPPFWAAILGPLVAVILLALRPICGVSVDPMIALPAGGLVGLIAMRRWSRLQECLNVGLGKMIGVSVLLIGTGAIAGIIKASSIKEVILDALSSMGISEALLAPISGALMSAATASTTAGATVASSSFAPTILAAGVSAVWGAAMINAGATVIDHLPHGSFFHATGGSVEMGVGDRLKLIPWECAIGFILAASSTVMYYIIG